MNDRKLSGKSRVLRDGANRWVHLREKNCDRLVGCRINKRSASSPSGSRDRRLAIGRLGAQTFYCRCFAHRSLEIDDLNVKRLRVGELVITIDSPAGYDAEEFD